MIDGKKWLAIRESIASVLDLYEICRYVFLKS